MELKKKAGVTILISDKIYFKTKTMKRGKGGHYIIFKGTIYQEAITLVNIYICLTYEHRCRQPHTHSRGSSQTIVNNG